MSKNEPAVTAEKKTQTVPEMPEREYLELRSRQLERLAFAAISLFDSHPLYWHVLSQLGRMDMTKHMPTMAVGFRNRKDPTVYLMYNTHWIASISDQKLRWVLKHELAHVGLAHLARMGDKIPKIANIAADLIINESILSDYEKFDDREKDAITYLNPPLQRVYTEEGEPVLDAAGGYTYKPHPEAGQLMFPVLKDIKVRDACMEEVYELLMQNVTVIEFVIEGIGKGRIVTDDHSFWGPPGGDGEGEGGKRTLTDEQKAAIERIAKDAVTALGGRDPGDVPGELRRQIDELRKVRHNWRRELTLFAQTVQKDDRESSWRRHNRRMGAAAPGHKKQYRARLLVAVDNSGSIGGPVYDLFMGHISVLSEILEEVFVIGVDTRVNFERKIVGGKIPQDMDMSSGGGTDFQPAFDYAKKGGFDGIVYLSDGYGGVPDRLGIPALFAICPGGQDVPGFKNLKIED